MTDTEAWKWYQRQWGWDGEQKISQVTGRDFNYLERGVDSVFIACQCSCCHVRCMDVVLFGKERYCANPIEMDSSYLLAGRTFPYQQLIIKVICWHQGFCSFKIIKRSVLRGEKYYRHYYVTPEYNIKTCSLYLVADLTVKKFADKVQDQERWVW